MAQQNGGTTSKIIKYEGNMTVRLLSSWARVLQGVQSLPNVS
jgi:hypothetical protein